MLNCNCGAQDGPEHNPHAKGCQVYVPKDLLDDAYASVKGTDKTEYVRFGIVDKKWYRSTQNPNCRNYNEKEWYMVHRGGVFHASQKAANTRTMPFDDCHIVGCRYAHHTPACPGSDCNCPTCQNPPPVHASNA